MKKINIYNQVMTAIHENQHKYKILNKNITRINHLRIGSLGIDVWPTTGTYMIDRVSHKKKHNDLIKILTRKKGSSNSELERRVIDLEEYCAFLEHEISTIKSHLAI